MNGATTEPCASTSSPPRTTVMVMMGSSQYLRRAPRKRHIWTTKSMRTSLEHVFEAAVGGSRRVAVDPVGLPLRLEAPRQRIPPGRAHDPGGRGEDAEINDPEHHGAHEAVQERTEGHPGAVERREPLRARQGDQGRDGGQGGYPGLEQGDQAEDHRKGPAERAIGR